MKRKAKVRCSTLKPHYTKQNLKDFWDFGNVVERPGIGAWGHGAKFAWAATSTKGKK